MDLNVGNVVINNHNQGTSNNDYQFVNTLASRRIVERVDTVYNQIQTDTAFIRVPVLQRRVMSRTTEDLAREAADQIFNIREWRIDVLRGDADYPLNGEAFMLGLQTFDRQEEQLMSLFAGASIENRQIVTFSVVPERATLTGDLFYFTENAGIVNRNTVGARTVWYEIGRVQTPTVSVSPSIQAANIIYYRIPQIVEVTTGVGGNIMATEQVTIYQFGSLVSFPLFAPPAR